MFVCKKKEARNVEENIQKYMKEIELFFKGNEW